MTIWTHEITGGEMMGLAEVTPPDRDEPEYTWVDKLEENEVCVAVWRIARNDKIGCRPCQRVNIVMRPIQFDHPTFII